jgi:hypothetical protein
MQMDDFLIPRLSIGACDDSLCVRASRFDPNDKAKLLHSDLVLIDEEVCKFFFIFLGLFDLGDGCI